MWANKPKAEFTHRTKDVIASQLSDIQPSKDLTKFQNELRKKMHGVQFALTLNDQRCWVYYPHETFVRGELYDYKSENAYAVVSRTIENGRYASYSSQHYMQWSGKLATAVKKAAAALTPWSVYEMAAVHCRNYEASRNEQVSESDGKLKQLFRELGAGRSTMAWRALQSMGDLIPDLDVRSKIQDITRQKEDLDSLTSVGANPMFVHICEDHRGNQRLATLRVHTRYSAIETDEQPQYLNELSDGYSDLVGKVSVLNMATVGEYVSGVGMKAAEDMFYVC
tara:strand:- start:3813 stop:4655 length:843 start_codon:yes stop_codon:yes gene_type:complete